MEALTGGGGWKAGSVGMQAKHAQTETQIRSEPSEAEETGRAGTPGPRGESCFVVMLRPLSLSACVSDTPKHTHTHTPRWEPDSFLFCCYDQFLLSPPGKVKLDVLLKPKLLRKGFT